jgi:hypothetical protein
MVVYIPSYGGPAEHWGSLPATRLASRKILIEQISKSGQGQHSVYSVVGPALYSMLFALGTYIISVVKVMCRLLREPGRALCTTGYFDDIL